MAHPPHAPQQHALAVGLGQLGDELEQAPVPLGLFGAQRFGVAVRPRPDLVPGEPEQATPTGLLPPGGPRGVHRHGTQPAAEGLGFAELAELLDHGQCHLLQQILEISLAGLVREHDGRHPRAVLLPEQAGGLGVAR